MEATLPTFYSNFLQATPLLTKEQECELSNDVLNGTKKKSENAVKKLVESNLRLVVKIAMRDYSWYSEKEDIISEGIIGLTRAAENYDSNYGARFSTYAAFYIKQKMMKYISKSSLIPMSTEMNKTYHRIQRIIDDISTELGYTPSLQEVAERFGSNVERLENILNYKFSYTKIDTPFDNIKGGKTLSDILKDENAVSPDKFAEYNSDVVELDEYLKGLKPRELFIIKKRFGFDGDEPMILQDIGNTLKITRERTRQIQEIALKKIKKNLKERNKLLKKSVDELEEKCNNAFR
jgi:RNA polymerase primary sigma factor